MKTVGLIVEYNPFHHGHAYHLHQSKQITKADAAIAVMSGNFLQRGEPALVNKWARAEMALKGGVDLVIELPSIYSSQPAEWFAFGAVSVLHATGIVDSLCFGTEAGTIEQLNRLASLLYNEKKTFKKQLQAQLKRGLNYPTAYNQAVNWMLNQDAQENPNIAQPNNNLGLHYLIALKRLNSNIRPFTIQRIKAEYHQQHFTDKQIASATAIRQGIAQSNNLEVIASYIPASTATILEREIKAGRGPIDWERFVYPLYHQLVSSSTDELAQILGIREGLEHRIKQTIFNCSVEKLSFRQLITSLKTKRYTIANLQRTLLNVLLNNKKEAFRREYLQMGASYIRILGFNERGRQLIKKMKTTATVPIITNVNKKNADLLAADIKAASVHTLAYPSPSYDDLFREFRQAPITV